MSRRNITLRELQGEDMARAETRVSSTRSSGSENLSFRLERIFPMYAMGNSKPDATSFIVLSASDPPADPIWDAIRAEAKSEGYHSLQSYRVAHILWNQGRKVLALAIQSRISEVFAVDIHPAAKIGEGILLDHATGLVIGETAVVGNKVSLMQGVTLGGTGKEVGDRHPKIGQGALIGAGATILGNIIVGDGAMIAAGSLVLKNVPPRSMAVGNPAKIIGHLEEEEDPSLTMKHDASKDYFEKLAIISTDGKSNGRVVC